MRRADKPFGPRLPRPRACSREAPRGEGRPVGGLGAVGLRIVALLSAVLVVVPLHAQARECRLPDRIAAARPEYPPPGGRRLLPVAGYTLALSWSPEFCRTRGRDPAHRLQCAGPGNGGAGRFGFILHGLWPEGAGPRWPQWCRRVEPLPAAIVRRHLCTTPSVQLIQHQWAKHGSCAARGAAGYLRAGSILFGAYRFPDMDALSRRSLTVRGFAEAFAARNPSVSPDMIRVQSNGRGWLTEVRVCLGRDLMPRRCPAHQRGAAPGETLRIWRGAGASG